MQTTNTISAQVYYNGTLAGTLSKTGKMYSFVYHHNYLGTPGSRPVSITLPLQKEPYQSELLFPVFVNRLSEGANKKIQARLLKIDENDFFGLLLATSGGDGIGPLTLKPNDVSPRN